MVDVSFSKPTLAQLIDQSESAFNTRLPGADSRVRNSALNVLARTVAGQTFLLYGYLDWIARQALVDTADAENLDNHGQIWGVSRVAASKAAGEITFTGTNGVTIPSGTQVQRSDGLTYTTTADGIISSGTVAVAAQADAAGTESDSIAGVTFTLVTPISGANSAATASGSGVVGGADIESDDAYRARIVARIQAPPHGGSKTDYEQWALQVAGVTRAWVYPNELGRGSVTVRFVRDNNTTPTPQNLATYSEDFSNAAWSATSVTVTPGGAIHPDAADVYTLTPGAADSRLRQQVTIWETGDLTFEVDVYGLGGARTFDLRVFAADGTTLLGSAASVVAPSGAWATRSVTVPVASGTSVWVQIGGTSSFATGENIAATKVRTAFSAYSSDYVKTTSEPVVGSLIIPTASDVQEVLDYISDDTRAPVTADVYVASPIAKRLDITITGLLPNTTAVQNAVLAELADMFTRDSEPGGTIYTSRIWEAVSIATGESSHTITTPSSNQTASTGIMWVLGKVTFA